MFTYFFSKEVAYSNTVFVVVCLIKRFLKRFIFSGTNYSIEVLAYDDVDFGFYGKQVARQMVNFKTKGLILQIH